MTEPAAPTANVGGLSPDSRTGEMRRFAAGMRAIMAMLCTGLLLAGPAGHGPDRGMLTVVLLAYDLWAGLLLLREARGSPLPSLHLHYAIDVTWTGLLLQLSGEADGLLILTAVQPVVLASIGLGVPYGVGLALYLALWVLLGPDAEHLIGLRLGAIHLATASAMLALVPVAALLARPVSVLRQRLGLMRQLENRLDPRRGLQGTATALVDGLRADLGANLAGVVLPVIADGPAVLCTADDGAFVTRPDAQGRLEALLRGLPEIPLTHRRHRRAGRLGATRTLGPVAMPVSTDQRRELDELCALLELRELLVVPFERYGQRHGHLLIGGGLGIAGPQTVDVLVEAAPEIFRILEQAALVDRLVRETAAHERARIGRDLHDSAIQPYLGLKFALEAIVRRTPPENPVQKEIGSLALLVESEIANLREIVSGLRDGAPSGDNALLPAVRRQVRHFSQLFGIRVRVEAPGELRTTRALAGAVFHMVNEALNNVRKHTSAREVHVSLAADGGWLRLSVRDDGAAAQGRPAPEFRPESLAGRVHELGGTLSVARPDGLNTEVIIAVPLDSVVPS